MHGLGDKISIKQGLGL